MTEGISIREFAKRDGCNEKLVRRKIGEGYLAVLADGKLDPALVGTAWRARNRKDADSADTGADRPADTPPVSAPAAKPADTLAISPETVEQAAERLVFSGRVFTSEAEAKRHKESFLALRQELEYDREIGRVVLIEDVVGAVTGEYALVRNRLLNVSSRVAPRAAVLRSPEEVKALIDSEIALVLEELRLAGPGGESPDAVRRTIRGRFTDPS